MIKTILIAAVAAAVLVPVDSVAQCATPNCGGWGWNRPGTYNYNVTGAWPGSGPYDSAIATTGIAAGAGVLSTIISAITAPRTTVVTPGNTTVVQATGGANTPQTTVITNQPAIVVTPVPGATPGATRVINSVPVCSMALVAYDTYGRPIYTPVCQ